MKCPYCDSENNTSMTDGKNVQRYRCNACCTSFSDTTGTIWHKTHLPAETREALEQAAQENKGVRETARNLGINKNTVSRAFDKIHGY
jgi:transposase-like protein